ncbi:hypothetical protein [Aureliella helgolandensis]|uniref:DUF3150 domain-containing protein n=1 Tax=Aureliella helgolandensis TaxID=2527968 RepID=A0A518G9M6_9BACT|nr:hypothetical protein [Aureliella helgolandensis]QDV25297.1 hypothetical protein Q31a_36210 [Aureliella helgolandensis]
MSTVTHHTQDQHSNDSSYQLRHSFSAMRLSFCWLGTRKSLSSDQLQQAANQFGAEGKFISAGKKLLDTGHPAMKGVSQLKRQITEYWKGGSLPYPEAGIRLVRHSDLDRLNQQMASYQEQLVLAVRELQANYDEIKELAAERLGGLFSESDYPVTLEGLFEVSWDFPSVEPPEYLRRLQPELYEQECQRVRSRFDEAVQLAEQAFVDELSGLVSHLGERLSGSDDGKPKVFRDSAVDNLREFFDRFGRLNVSSCPELDQLVERARDIVTGVGPSTLRSDSSLRQQVASQLSSVQSVLDGLMVDRPRRRILRG